MDYHQNARLTVHSREQLARYVFEQGSTLKAAAAAFNVSDKTAAKWVQRYREHGRAGMKDLSSKPHRLLRHPARSNTPLCHAFLPHGQSLLHTLRLLDPPRAHRQRLLL